MEYNEQLVQQVWEKARVNSKHYGDSDSNFGWIIINVSAGGPGILENLRPFHHRNSYNIADQHEQCRVTADRTDLPPFEHSPEPRNRAI